MRLQGWGDLAETQSAVPPSERFWHIPVSPFYRRHFRSFQRRGVPLCSGRWGGVGCGALGMAEATGRRAGRHPQRALTAAFVRNTTKPERHVDGHGLYVEVGPSGAKRWLQRLVIRGKRTDLGLGSAALVTLAEAREVALANRKLAREWGDPLRAWREADTAPTFAEAARRVHEMHRLSWRNPKHAAQFISTLETYAFPLAGRPARGRCDHGRRARCALAHLAHQARDRAARAPAHRTGDEVGRGLGLAPGQPGRCHRSGAAAAPG